MTAKNIFAEIPKDLAGEIFETLIDSRDLKIERIVSRGHSSPASGWYNQDLHEWVMVLQGAATISYPDRDDVSLAVGDYLHIPAHTRHRVAWTDPASETIWLAVHYA